MLHLGLDEQVGVAVGGDGVTAQDGALGNGVVVLAGVGFDAVQQSHDLVDGRTAAAAAAGDGGGGKGAGAQGQDAGAAQGAQLAEQRGRTLIGGGGGGGDRAGADLNQAGAAQGAQLRQRGAAGLIGGGGGGGDRAGADLDQAGAAQGAQLRQRGAAGLIGGGREGAADAADDLHQAGAAGQADRRRDGRQGAGAEREQARAAERAQLAEGLVQRLVVAQFVVGFRTPGVAAIQGDRPDHGRGVVGINLVGTVKGDAAGPGGGGHIVGRAARRRLRELHVKPRQAGRCARDRDTARGNVGVERHLKDGVRGAAQVQREGVGADGGAGERRIGTIGGLGGPDAINGVGGGAERDLGGGAQVVRQHGVPGEGGGADRALAHFPGRAVAVFQLVVDSGAEADGGAGGERHKTDRDGGTQGQRRRAAGVAGSLFNAVAVTDRHHRSPSYWRSSMKSRQRAATAVKTGRNHRFGIRAFHQRGRP